MEDGPKYPMLLPKASLRCAFRLGKGVRLGRGWKSRSGNQRITPIGDQENSIRGSNRDWIRSTSRFTTM